MAWTKSIKREDNGAEATHWDVISIVYDHREQLSRLTAGGWVDAQAYADNLQPLIIKEWSIPSGLAPQLATGAVTFVTSYAMGQPEFEGAILL